MGRKVNRNTENDNVQHKTTEW